MQGFKDKVSSAQIYSSDGTVMKAESTSVVEYEVEKLQTLKNSEGEEFFVSEQLEFIRMLNDDAVCYPKEHEKGWICICGHLNKRNRQADSLVMNKSNQQEASFVLNKMNQQEASLVLHKEENEKCTNCGCEKEQIFKKCSKDNIMMNLQEERKRRMAENARRENVLKQEADARRKKQRIKVGLGVSAVACILGFYCYRETHIESYALSGTGELYRVCSADLINKEPAKEAADSYCRMIKSKHDSSIQVISDTGRISGSGDTYYFDYSVRYYDGTVRNAYVIVEKQGPEWKATKMIFE